VHFICGGRAARDYAAKHALLVSVASGISTDWREIPRIVGKLAEEGREQRKRIEELGAELTRYRAIELSRPTGAAGGFDLIKKAFDAGDATSLRETAARIREAGGKIVLFGLAGAAPALIFACSQDVPLNMGELMKACAALMGARGGGGKDFAQGGGGDAARVGEALDEAERRIRAALG